MGAGPHPVRPQGQTRLGPFQRLALAFFIATEHHCTLGRIEVETDHVPEFRFKIFIVGNFEGPGDVRLDVIGAPQALDRVMGHPFGFGHGAGGPLGPARRWQCRLSDDFGPGLRGNRRLATGAAGFREPGKSALHKAPFPFCDYRTIDAHQSGRPLLAVPSGAGEDNTRPPDFPLGCLGSFDHGLKFPELDGIKRQNMNWAGHAPILHDRAVLYRYLSSGTLAACRTYIGSSPNFLKLHDFSFTRHPENRLDTFSAFKKSFIEVQNAKSDTLLENEMP